MKRKYLFIMILMIFYGCQSNNEIIPCNVDVSNRIGYVDGKVYNGTCNIYYNDSILWKQRTYKRGKLTKELGYYIPSGELEYEGQRKDWEIHGDFVSYYKNGKEVSLSNWSIPGDVLEDKDVFVDWFFKSYQVAINKKIGKK